MEGLYAPTIDLNAAAEEGRESPGEEAFEKDFFADVSWDPQAPKASSGGDHNSDGDDRDDSPNDGEHGHGTAAQHFMPSEEPDTSPAQVKRLPRDAPPLTQDEVRTKSEALLRMVCEAQTDCENYITRCQSTPRAGVCALPSCFAAAAEPRNTGAPPHPPIVRGYVPLGMEKLLRRIVKERDTITRHMNNYLRHEKRSSQKEEAESDASSSDSAHETQGPPSLSFLKCNNVPWLSAVVHALHMEKDVVAVLHGFSVSALKAAAIPNAARFRALAQAEGSASRSIEACHIDVDIVSCNGARWVKVKAGSPANLETELTGRTAHLGSMGGKGTVRSFVDTMQYIVQQAAHNDMLMMPFDVRPEVAIAFSDEPTPLVRQMINEQCCHCYYVISNNEAPALVHPLSLLTGTCLNFDVTALVAFCADVTNGHAGYRHPRHPILDKQSVREAEGERCLEDYMSPILNYFDGPSSSMPCRWVCTRLAWAEFEWILSTVAGLQEIQRAEELRRRVMIVDHPSEVSLENQRDAAHPKSAVAPNLDESDSDEAQPPSRLCDQRDPCVTVPNAGNGRQYVTPSNRIAKLIDTCRISSRHKVVFGVGDALHAVTLSANRQFVQAAKEQGVTLLVALHPPRALTEKKRLHLSTAEPEFTKREIEMRRQTHRQQMRQMDNDNQV